MFTANHLTDAKHSTNHLTDIDKNKHNCIQRQHKSCV